MASGGSRPHELLRTASHGEVLGLDVVQRVSPALLKRLEGDEPGAAKAPAAVPGRARLTPAVSQAILASSASGAARGGGGQLVAHRSDSRAVYSWRRRARFRWPMVHGKAAGT